MSITVPEQIDENWGLATESPVKELALVNTSKGVLVIKDKERQKTEPITVNIQTTNAQPLRIPKQPKYRVQFKDGVRQRLYIARGKLSEKDKIFAAENGAGKIGKRRFDYAAQGVLPQKGPISFSYSQSSWTPEWLYDLVLRLQTEFGVITKNISGGKFKDPMSWFSGGLAQRDINLTDGWYSALAPIYNSSIFQDEPTRIRELGSINSMRAVSPVTIPNRYNGELAALGSTHPFKYAATTAAIEKALTIEADLSGRKKRDMMIIPVGGIDLGLEAEQPTSFVDIIDLARERAIRARERVSSASLGIGLQSGIPIDELGLYEICCSYIVDYLGAEAFEISYALPLPWYIVGRVFDERAETGKLVQCYTTVDVLNNPHRFVGQGLLPLDRIDSMQKSTQAALAPFIVPMRFKAPSEDEIAGFNLAA